MSPIDKTVWSDVRCQLQIGTHTIMLGDRHPRLKQETAAKLAHVELQRKKINRIKIGSSRCKVKHMTFY